MGIGGLLVSGRHANGRADVLRRLTDVSAATTTRGSTETYRSSEVICILALAGLPLKILSSSGGLCTINSNSGRAAKTYTPLSRLTT